jgi:tetratricopeptide (TPR) repeat protein
MGISLTQTNLFPTSRQRNTNMSTASRQLIPLFPEQANNDHLATILPPFRRQHVHRRSKTQTLSLRFPSIQFTGRSIQQRHFHSSPECSFDPMKSPLSASLLKPFDNTTDNDEDDDDDQSSVFSPEEIELKECLEAYQDVQQRRRRRQTGDASSVVTLEFAEYSDVLDRLHHAYTALEYWEEALQVEETKCQDCLMVDEDGGGGGGGDDYADSIHVQGKLWLRQGNFERSKPLYEQALEYFQTTENRVQEGHVWISLAGWYYFQYEQQIQQQHGIASSSSSSSLDTAMDYLQRAEVLLDSNPTLLVKCLDNQGLICRLWGDFDGALDKYQQALQVVVDESTRRALQLHVADMMVAMEVPHQALVLYQELLQECQQTPATKTETVGMQGVLWHNIATIHVQLRAYDLAEDEFRQSLQCKQESAGSEDHPELAKGWNALGALYYGVLDEKRQALECFRRVLWIARVHSDHEDHSTDPQVLAVLQTISDIEEQLDKER